MKTLFIIRHAKSSWDNTSLNDFERPLNTRGLRDAPLAGQNLVDRKENFDLIISSPAVRAIATARLIASELAYHGSAIQQDHSFYHASPKTIIRAINQVGDKVNSLAVFGHNPGLTDLVNELADFDLPNLPTAGIVKISFPFHSWELVSFGTGNIEYQLFPKDSDFD